MSDVEGKVEGTNTKILNQMDKILKIFHASEGAIRPHFILTGPSGSGKSHTVTTLAERYGLNFVEINAAQLTKEGTSGNSLSKALSPIKNSSGALTICFVDEFDKLFISGNSNSHLAHETTNGVQNEFLKVLESDHATVYDDYGKYIDVPVDKVLFVFAGAFNGEEDVSVDRLRDFGIKTEFIGRVGLIYNLKKLTINELFTILNKSILLEKYLSLFPTVKKEFVVSEIMQVISENYEKNTLGVRIITTLLNKFFIEGGISNKESTKKVTFQKTLDFGVEDASQYL